MMDRNKARGSWIDSGYVSASDLREGLGSDSDEGVKKEEREG